METMNRHKTALLPILAICLASAVSEPEIHAQRDDLPTELREAQVTFVELCAPCHGVLGDGKGTAVLDRPARSFKDGGFSFGNTNEALVRTLKSGIPGTPMPAFGGQVPDERIKELARLVQFMGPGGEPEPPRGTELVVKDRPLMVRGKFPALEGEEGELVRGLMFGEPSGMSFQYSIDDVRLESVRLGGFINRDDWGGRGGSPLRPLGKVIHAPKDPAHPAMWRRSSGGSLKAALRSTSTAGGVAALSYELVTSKGEVLASCEERPRMLSTTHGSGYALAYTIKARESALVTIYPFSGPTSQSWTLNGGGEGDTGALTTGRVRCNRPLNNPGNELRMLSYAPGVLHAERGVELSLYAGKTLNFEVGVVFLTEWSDENAMHVLKGVSRGDV
jgi:mono/diheme cytochrome c family protein